MTSEDDLYIEDTPWLCWYSYWRWLVNHEFFLSGNDLAIPIWSRNEVRVWNI